jgi:serine/threonine protein kinase
MSDNSFQRLEDPSTRFEVLEELGAGSYGRVFRARDKQRGKEVAVKAMSCDADSEGIVIDREAMEKEVQLMRSLSKNEFIITYFDAFNCVKLREFWISMEVCEIGSCLVSKVIAAGVVTDDAPGPDSDSARSFSRRGGSINCARLHAGAVLSASAKSCT